jgi:hypothetical protein
MKTYEVQTSDRNGIPRGRYGPFTSRVEAERTVVTLAGREDIHNARIVEFDDE